MRAYLYTVSLYNHKLDRQDNLFTTLPIVSFGSRLQGSLYQYLLESNLISIRCIISSLSRRLSFFSISLNNKNAQRFYKIFKPKLIDQCPYYRDEYWEKKCLSFCFIGHVGCVSFARYYGKR